MKTPTTRRPSKPISAAEHRRRLLRTLRAQSQAIGACRFTREAAPELYDLAQTPTQGRSVYFGGIRFPLKYGIWRYICDPDCSAILVASRGGWL